MNSKTKSHEFSNSDSNWWAARNDNILQRMQEALRFYKICLFG